MNAIGYLEVAGSHREVGLAIGRRFRNQIRHFLSNYSFLQEQLRPFHRGSRGRDLYAAFLARHRSHFPGYIAELEGIAQGAQCSFEEIFLVNVRGEYGGMMAQASSAADPAVGEVQECTDCLVLTSGVAVLGHNEDGTPIGLGNMFVVTAQVNDRSAFTALCYPGFLPGNAFGYNASGVLHTVDAVSPRRIRIGLGRHFIARSLLDASSLDDAIRRVTVQGRAAGFTYNIGSLSQRALVSVEVSSDQHHVHQVRGHYLHTNHYLKLTDVQQEIGPSSQARLARAEALCRATPPRSAAQVLSLLGDEVEREYPIYRNATPPDRSATLCTALFDLDSRQLRICAGHPSREPECQLLFDL